MSSELDRVVLFGLLQTMRPGLKRALDDAIARGASRLELLAGVRRQTGGPHGRVKDGRRQGGTVYLQCWAYLFPESETDPLAPPGA